MKRGEVERIVDENIEGLKIILGLASWRITVEYGKVVIPGRKDGEFGGKCVSDPAHYESALIVIDPKLHSTPDEVLETLTHELAHCLTGCFEQLMQVMEEFVTPEQFRALDVMYYHAVEQLVERICRIITLTPQMSVLRRRCGGSLFLRMWINLRSRCHHMYQSQKST